MKQKILHVAVALLAVCVSICGISCSKDENAVVVKEDGVPLATPDKSEWFCEPFVITDGSTVIALKADGTVWSWGTNRTGCLGDGTNTNRSSIQPVKDPNGVDNLKNIVQIVFAEHNVWALSDNGKVYGWGRTFHDSLGLGDNKSNNIPTELPNLSNIKQISGGLWGLLALKNDGTVWATGHIFSTQGDQSTAVQVKGANGQGWLNNIKKVVCVDGALAYALSNTGEVYHWTMGSSSSGSHQYKYNRYLYPTKLKIGDVSNNTKKITDINEYIALREDGTVWTWFRNDYGQLGINKLDPQDTLITFDESTHKVHGISDGFLSNIKKLEYSMPNGITHFVRDEDNKLIGWGSNGRFRITNLTSDYIITTPIITGIYDDSYSFNGYSKIMLDGTVYLSDKKGDITNSPVEANEFILRQVFCEVGGAPFNVFPDTTPTPTETQQPVAEKNLWLDIEKTETAKLTIRNENDNIIEDMAWSSTNSEVATVDNQGVVTAINEGNAVINAKDGDEEVGQINVKVIAAPTPEGSNQPNANIDLAREEYRASVTASSAYSGSYTADKAVDGDSTTHWGADWDSGPDVLTLTFKETYTFNYIRIKEEFGRVGEYTLEYLKPGTANEWIVFSEGETEDLAGGTVINDFGKVTSKAIRLTRDTPSEGPAAISSFEVKYMP